MMDYIHSLEGPRAYREKRRAQVNKFSEFENNDGSTFLEPGSIGSIDIEGSYAFVRDTLRRQLRHCNERDRSILEDYFFDNKVMRSIAKKYGVSVQRIQQIIKKYRCDFDDVVKRTVENLAV